MRHIYHLNTKWAFTKEADEPPKEMPDRWYYVNLPHTWNNIDGQDGGADYYRGTCYYAKEVEMSELPEAEQYFLELRGANSSADVYVNGEKLAHHDGGYSAWRVNITDALKERNLFVIAVDNSANDEVYPQNADFTFYGGLYRDVAIIAVPRSHFDLEYYGGPGMTVTAQVEGENAKVNVKVFLSGERRKQELHYQIHDAQGNLVAEEYAPVTVDRVSFEIPDVHLWQGRKDPYLYTATVTLLEDNEELDLVSTKFGCRSFEIDPKRGFLLNGESYPLRGVSRHQDWWGIGNALLPEHHRRDMELICELGATTIRLAHYQHDDFFYDLCDEKGMVVWAEIPYISAHMQGGRENTISQMKELIIQNYNHPSIVVWGLSNEITMKGEANEDLLENHRILNDLAHELDPFRKTAIAVVSMCETDSPYLKIPDVVSYNHYFGWYGGDTSMNGPWLDQFHEKYPQIPLGVSEYGCEALNWHTSNPQQGDYTEEYQAYYHEELIKQLYTRPYLWATHVWNMFDFGADARNEGGENGQNHKGLVTFDRNYKKDAFYAYKAWLSDEPFVHICGKRYINREEEVTKVTVYSNQPEVELFVNGKSVGKQRSREHFFYFQVQNQGESHLKAVAGAYEDESRIRKVEEFDEAYRMKEIGAVLNWFDITAPEGYFSLNDKLCDIFTKPEGKELVLGALGGMEGKRGEDGAHGKSAKSGADKGGEKGAGGMFDEKMFDMMGSFTVLRLINLMGAVNEKMTKEQLLDLNSKLNQIKRD